MDHQTPVCDAHVAQPATATDSGARSAARERPILFSGPMVRALLAGTKTQTRRAIKEARDPWSAYQLLESSEFTPEFVADPGNHLCPYGVPGDVLWVREAWRVEGRCDDIAPRDLVHDWPVHYEAGVWSDLRNEVVTIPGTTAASGRLRPGIHMPRWACRLRLRITDVRVERLSDCSPADAIAEGIEQRLVECGDGAERSLYFGVPQAGYEFGAAGQGPVQAYADLWDSINNPRGLCADDAPHGWEANPWVWAVSFEVIRSQDGTAERSALPREAPKPNSTETVAATGLEADPGCKTEPSNG